jgi:hypothetical protein
MIGSSSGSMVRRCVTWTAWTAWAMFTAWLTVFGMWGSAVIALVAAIVSRPGSRSRWVWRALVWTTGILAVPLLGLPEYAVTTHALHCRTLGFMGGAKPQTCDGDAWHRGAEVARSGGPLYTARERLGVHGFNHLMALGGVVAGLPEVARETVWLSWTADPFPGGAAQATTAQRRRQCASTGPKSGMSLGSTRVWWTDFPMRSSHARRALASALPRLPKHPGRSVSAGSLHFIGSGNNNEAYLTAALEDSVRVGLALEVSDSSLQLERVDNGDVEASWSGTIHYPGTHTAFVLPVPTLFGPEVMVSEAVFCGMQVDGAMNPYPLEVRWDLDPDDPQLSKDDRARTQRAWMEWVVHQAAQLLR